MTLLPTYAIIVILIKNKDIYNKYIKYINITKDKDNYLYNIYRVIKLLFNDKDSFTLDELELCLYSQFPMLKQEEVKTYQIIFASIRSAEVSDDMLMKLLHDIEARAKAEQIGMLAFDVAEGRADPSKLAERLEDFTTYKVDQDESSDDDIYVPDLVGIFEARAKMPGLRWRLKALNQMLGPLRKGNYGVAFARPETGKTTFLASEITFMAQQCSEEHPVIWFNNEESRDAVAIRIIQGTLGITKEQYSQNIKGFAEQYQKEMGRRLVLVDDASLTRHKAEKIIERLEPGLVVVDQIGKVQGFEEDRDDLKLGAIHQWGRQIAKTVCPAIGIAQADGTAEGMKWLNQGHVANAKTAIQAEADWILGIGKTHKQEEEMVRFLHCPKNKLEGGEESVEEMRHGRVAVLIEPTIARYKDIE